MSTNYKGVNMKKKKLEFSHVALIFFLLIAILFSIKFYYGYENTYKTMTALYNKSTIWESKDLNLKIFSIDNKHSKEFGFDKNSIDDSIIGILNNDKTYKLYAIECTGTTLQIGRFDGDSNKEIDAYKNGIRVVANLSMFNSNKLELKVLENNSDFFPKECSKIILNKINN